MLELGIFLPITNNGWIISHNSPQFSPSFEMNKRLTQQAEQLDFAFAFSMVKWRGFGGELGFWDEALESLTLMAGLAAVTERIQLIGSLQPLTYHPAVAARMITTIDNISNGRFGVNLVGGSNRAEYVQMGLWPGDDYYNDRYDHLTEWTQVATELWETGRSSFRGEYYSLDDCQALPRPSSRPHPTIISAGMSDRGLAFASRYADANFVAGFGLEETRALAERTHAASSDAGRPIKCYGTFTIIQGASDAAATERLRSFDEGVDQHTLQMLGGHIQQDVGTGATMSEIGRGVVAPGSSVFTPSLVGSADSIADHLQWLAEETEVDGIMLTFPDWEADLALFGSTVVPELRRRGITAGRTEA